jgi:hypothetical protein
MKDTAILLPALSLVGWTLLVLLLVPYRRFKAAFAGQVSARDFKFGESERVPADVSIPNRNFMNLLEAPVLFYVVCVITFVTHNVDASAVNLAWTYFGLRVVHSLVHLTYNKVTHRLVAYAASMVVLVSMWIHLMVAVASS